MATTGTVIATAAGVFAGISTVLLGSLVRPSTRPVAGAAADHRESANENSGVISSPAAVTATVDQIAELQRQISALKPTNQVAVPAAVPARTLTPEQRAERQRERVAEHEDKIAAHWQEPIDSNWAPRAEKAIAEDLAVKAKNVHFEVSKVDCRFATCLAEVSYPTYGEAFTNALAMVLPGNGSRCASHVVNPPPDDLNAPYSSTIVFDNCTKE